MIVETGMVAKAIAAGGGLVSSIVLLAGISGGAQYAAVSVDPAQMTNAICGYASSPPDTSDVAKLGLSVKQIINAQIIVTVAIKLKLPRRAAEIALGTALQESRLDNGAVGSRGASLGLFQQQPSAGWGSREQVTTPSYAARAFYRRLVRVRGWQAMPLTKAAAIVQRPRRDLRGQYAKHEPLAKKLVATLWTSRTTKPAKTLGLTAQEQVQVRNSLQAAAALGIPREAAIADLAAQLRQTHGNTPVSPDAIQKHAESIVNTVGSQLCTELNDAPIIAGSGQSAVAVAAALSQRGIPYSWGGGGPGGPSYGIGRGANTKGFDCSGLTEYAWSKAGVSIGSTTYEQWDAGPRVPRSQIRAGDLIFYETDSSQSGPDHVGIAVSRTEIVNAPHTGAVVRLDPIDRSGYVGAIRPS